MGRGARIHGAAECDQIGLCAWTSILTSNLTGACLSDAPALLLIDATPRVGECMESFFKVKELVASKTSLFYLGIADDQTHKEWLEDKQIEQLAQSHWLRPPMPSDNHNFLCTGNVPKTTPGIPQPLHASQLKPQMPATTTIQHTTLN